MTALALSLVVVALAACIIRLDHRVRALERRPPRIEVPVAKLVIERNAPEEPMRAGWHDE